MATVIHSEFERFVTFSDVLQRPSHLVLDAKPEERVALAKRLGVLKMESFKVHVSFTPKKLLKRVEVVAQLKAVLQQECVVTLEPVKNTLTETVHLILTSGGSLQSDHEAILYEGPEIITCKERVPLDIGEIFTQYLCLFMDNFPRALP